MNHFFSVTIQRYLCACVDEIYKDAKKENRTGGCFTRARKVATLCKIVSSQTPPTVFFQMSLFDLPDIALIKICRTLDHPELVRLYLTCRSSARIQNLIENSPCLWTAVHIQATVDYRVFSYFVRLSVANATAVRTLTIDELDLTCRKILDEHGFSLKKFSQLEQLTIHDEHICQTLASINFSVPTLKALRLTNDHRNLNHVHPALQLSSLECTLYSLDTLTGRLDHITHLNLKIMFDYDQNARRVFSHLPHRHLHSLTLKFLLNHPDANFSHECRTYLQSCSFLHTLELSYLHGMCPVVLHTDFAYASYVRMILLNICPLKEMQSFIESRRSPLPCNYLQWNSSAIVTSSSLHIRYENWHEHRLISIDYLQCVTTSMDLFNECDISWSDKRHKTQSFESYILRSIYNAADLLSSIQNLSIRQVELSLNGFVMLLTSLPSLRTVDITDGKIDQMGAALVDMRKLIRSQTNDVHSDIRSLTCTSVQMSRRTAMQLCLLTAERLQSLTLNDVRLLDKFHTVDSHSNFLPFLKHIAQCSNRWTWTQLTSLTLGTFSALQNHASCIEFYSGKNMIHRQNLLSFTPCDTNHAYSTNVTHLRIINHDHTLFESHDVFLKAMKRLVAIHPKLTSFIVEFAKLYEGQFRLRNQLQALFERHVDRRILVYRTVHDRACRFCFEPLDDDEQQDEPSSTPSREPYRTFCGVPLFHMRKQRKSIACS